VLAKNSAPYCLRKKIVCACCLLQILQLYKDYIHPEFTWSNFTVEEQAKVIVAPRSNNLLDTERVRNQQPAICNQPRSFTHAKLLLAMAWLDVGSVRCSFERLRCAHHGVCCALQIESEFPQILPIRESLIKYVFEPNAAKVRSALPQKLS
jgi:hypothetical protein